MKVTEKFLRRLLQIEGDFSNHPHDTGGATRYGITEALARRHGYRGRMSELPHDLAFTIYEAEFIRKLGLDRVAEIYEPLAWELFEFAVHSGVSRSVETLQRLLNANNLRGVYWPDLDVDGAMGPRTLGALSAYAKRRGKEGLELLTIAFNGIQISFYLSLVEDPRRLGHDETWFYGWLQHRARL